MRRLALIATVMVALVAMALPANAHKLAQYTYTYDAGGSLGSCYFRSIYGQYGSNAFAEMQQQANPGSHCSAWSGIELVYHDGSQVRSAWCSILGKAYNPGAYPHCELLGPGLGIRVVKAGALLEMRPYVCYWTESPSEPYPPCQSAYHWVL